MRYILSVELQWRHICKPSRLSVSLGMSASESMECSDARCVLKSVGCWSWGVSGFLCQVQVGKGQLWFVGVLFGCPLVDFDTDVGNIDVIKG